MSETPDENPLLTNSKSETILQDQSKNYMAAKSFMLRKLGLACFGAALPLPHELQNTVRRHRRPAPLRCGSNTAEQTAVI
jgi:hypothetical protein